MEGKAQLEENGRQEVKGKGKEEGKKGGNLPRAESHVLYVSISR